MNICPTCHTQYPDTTRLCPKDGAVLEGQAQAPQDPNVGRTLDGKYRLDARLSSGGMGTVYRATHVMLGKSLAVKLIKAELAPSVEVVRRFQREAQAASALNHPNIAPAYDLGQTPDGTLYIAMELVKGPSLKEVIQKSGQLDPSRIVGLLTQVASALALAHRHEIIHRDLKPQNIMITTDGHGREVAKLLDFGIAKTLDESATQLTSAGFSLGTPQYMSPEQAYGKPVDGRSDLYSLGTILYEMLVGEVPFNDPSTPAVLVKQMTELPVSPARRRPDLAISPELEAIALKCLEKDPAARYQTAEEFSAAMSGALGAISASQNEATLLLTPAPAATAAATVIGGALPLATAPPAPVIEQTTRTSSPTPVVERQTTRAAAPSTPVVPAAVVVPAAAAPVIAAPPIETARRVSPAPARPASRGPMLLMAAAGLVLAAGAFGAYRLGYFGGSPTPAAETAGSAPSAPAPSAVQAELPAPPITASSPPPAPQPAASQPGAPPAPTAEAQGPARTPASEPRAQAPAAQTQPQPIAAPPPATSSPDRVPAAAPAPPPAAPAAEPRPANPSVFFKCGGPADVCGALRSAVDQALAKDSLPGVRDPARAEIVVEAAVEFVDENVNRQFGQAMAVRTYSIEVSGEDRRTSATVSMPGRSTVSFDPRVGQEKLNERARLVAADIVEKVRAYWKK